MKKNGLKGERLLNCHQEKIASWVHREAQDIYQSFLKVDCQIGDVLSAFIK